MESQIILNIASLAPRSAFDLDWAVRVAKNAGFDGISTIPFWSCREPRRLDLPVRFAEDAWNPGDIFDVWRGFRGDPKAPKLQDWALFPHNADYCRKIFFDWLDFDRRTRPIVHHWPDFWKIQRQRYHHPLLEVHPGLRTPPEEIIDLLQTYGLEGHYLDLDTRHLRRDLRPDETGGETQPSAFGPWQESIPKLLPYAGLVDFQAMNREELLATLEGEVTDLWQMVALIRNLGYEGPWRVEVNLGLPGQLRFGYLTEVLTATRNWLALAIGQGT